MATKRTMGLRRRDFVMACLAAGAAGRPAFAQGGGWEPSQPVRFVVPAGAGGGADEMARAIQTIVTRNRLMRQPLEVVNKSAGGGAEGFREVQQAHGNPHLLMIGLTNLFTTPLATGMAFSWRDLTPVSMLALDEFVLWVHAELPYRTVADSIAAAKAGEVRMGGTGSKQEDELVTSALARATGARFTYVPLRGGGDVARALVERKVDATVNNPAEAVSDWIGGDLRPLCVFERNRLELPGNVTATESWGDIATCRELGIDVEYTMLRGVFMAPGVAPEQVAFYVNLLERVRETPAWREMLVNGAFNPTTMSGDAFVQWLTREEARHRTWMREAGFLPPS